MWILSTSALWVWVWIWLAVLVLSLIVEFVTMELVSIWFSAGSLTSLILAICRVSPYVQLIVFIALSLACMLGFRKLALKFLLEKDNEKTNSDSFIGKVFKLTSGIAENKPGTVKINGVEWNVVTDNEDDEIPEGTHVVIKKISGNKLIVEKKEIK